MCENHKRTYGIELEGYTNECIRGNIVLGWKLVGDGSLNDDRYECDYCNGNGEYEHECQECNGAGNDECEECCGSGEIPCGECDCSGMIDDEYGISIDCPECEGNGYVTCYECGGDGSFECTNCGGSGYYDDECEECGGSGYYGDGLSGVECVSGICEEGNYDSISHIFDYIGRYDWTVNGDCGTHVHIGGEDLQASDLSKLYILANVVEPMIYGTLPSERIEGSYAKKTYNDKVDYLINIGDKITLQQLANTYYGYNVRLDYSFARYSDARYYGLNLHSWFYRKTVEFRYFEGCDNKEQAIAWIDLCIKLVDFAKYVSFDQLKVIGSDLFTVENLTEYIEKVRELLGLEYYFRPYSNYAYEIAKRNLASVFTNASVIERAV
jgi:hypothetical protein